MADTSLAALAGLDALEVRTAGSPREGSRQRVTKRLGSALRSIAAAAYEASRRRPDEASRRRPEYNPSPRLI